MYFTWLLHSSDAVDWLKIIWAHSMVNMCRQLCINFNFFFSLTITTTRFVRWRRFCVSQPPVGSRRRNSALKQQRRVAAVSFVSAVCALNGFHKRLLGGCCSFSKPLLICLLYFAYIYAFCCQQRLSFLHLRFLFSGRVPLFSCSTS